MITRSFAGKYYNAKIKINAYDLNQGTRKKLIDKQRYSQTQSIIKLYYNKKLGLKKEYSSQNTLTFRKKQIELNKF